MAGEITKSFALKDRQARDNVEGIAISKAIVTGLQTPEPGTPKGLNPAERGIFDSAAEVSSLDTLEAAADRTGIVSEGGIESIKNIIKPFTDDTEYDPDLDMEEVLKQEVNATRAEFMKDSFARQSPADKRLHQALIASPNEADSLDLIDTHMQNLREQEEASASGAALELLGTFLGASKDAVISLPIGGAGVAGARATGLVARGLVELGIYSGTEAAVAGAERLLRAQRDFTIDGDREALEAAIIAGGLTAILGGGAVAIARRNEVMDMIRKRAVTDDAGRGGVQGGSVSAADTPDLHKNILSRTPGSIVARFIPQALRTLKGIVTDRIADATTRWGKTGLKHDLDSANVLDRLIGPQIDRVDIPGNPAAKRPGLEDALMSGRDEGALFSVLIREQHAQFHQNAFGGKKSPVSTDEFDRLVSRTIWARNKGNADPELILGKFSEVLSQDAQSALTKSLNTAADIIKERTLSNGKRGEKSGLLQEGQAIEDYMPISPRRGGGATEDDYYEYFLDMLHRPSDESINDILPGRLEEGETFEQILKADPDRAREISDDLDASLLRSRGDKAYEAELASEDGLNKFLGTTRDDLKGTWERRLRTLEAAPKRKRGAKRLAEDAKEIETLKLRLQELDAVDLPKLRSMIGKFGNTKQKVALRDLSKVRGKAARQAKKAADAEPVSEVARRIAKNIMEGKNAGNIVPDRLTSNAGFTKDRVIDHDFFDPRFEQLFETRASVNLRVHSQQLHPRLYLHETFGGVKKANEDIVNVPLRLMDEAAEGGSDGAKARIRDDKETAEAALKAALNRDRIPHSTRARAFDFWSQQIAKFNIASMLKMLGITQITDLALVLGRGRSPTSGVMGVFNARETFRLARAARAEGQLDITRILEGQEIMGIRNPMEDFRNVNASKRVMDQYGIDADEIMARSKLEHSVEKGLDAVNGIAGWLSFATPMNMVLRRAMGADTAKMIVSDMVGFRGLSDDIQRRWLNYGIDADTADELAAFIKGPDGTVTIEGVAFPNYRKLRELDPKLADVAVTATNRLAGEVFPVVTPFTKPLLSRTPVGRLALQFSSFSYAVGVSVLPELKREMRHNPLGYRAAALTLGGMMASMTTLYLRAAIYGNGNLEKIHEQMGSVEGSVQLAQRAALLLPFLPGMSSQITEIAANSFGPSINAVTGHDYLLANPARFMRTGDNMLMKLAGPTGTQFSRLVGAGGRVVEAAEAELTGDREKAKEELTKSARTLHMMMPIIDNLPLRAVTAAYKRAYPE